MKVSIRTTLILLLSLLLASAAPTAEQIAKAIKELGAADFPTREKATLLLWSAGKSVEPALREASKSKDPEVAERARHLLDNITLGILPDTPEDVRELARRYHRAKLDEKGGIIGSLFGKGEMAFPVITAIADSEKDEAMRKQIFGEVVENSAKVVPKLIADGGLAQAELVLQLATASGEELALRNYAAFLLQQGRLKEKIREYRARAEAADGQRDATLLAILYRADGDLAQARWAAERSKDVDVRKGVFAELGDWKAVAAVQAGIPPKPEPAGEIERLGFLASYYRLAGMTNEFEQTLKVMIAADNSRTSQIPSDSFQSCDNLYVNDRPQMAIRRIVDTKYPMNALGGDAFAALCTQRRFGEVIQLVKRVAGEGAKEAFYSQLSLAELLSALGEREPTVALLQKLADERKDAADTGEFISVLGTIYQTGDYKLLAECGDERIDNWPEAKKMEAFRLLVAKGELDLAQICWKTFRPSSSKEAFSLTVERACKLWTAEGGQESTVMRRKLIELVAELQNEKRNWMLRFLATEWERDGDFNSAVACYERITEDSNSSESLTTAARLLLRQKRWDDAAKLAEKASLMNKANAVAMFVRGWKTQQSGDQKSGEKLMQTAELLPLADGGARLRLAQTAAEVGLTDIVKREYDLIRRTGDFFYDCDEPAPMALADVAVAKGDFLEAAEIRQRMLLSVIRNDTINSPSTNTWFTWEDNLLDPHRIHLLRARGLLAKNEVESAMHEARLCMEYLPGDVTMPIAVVPELDRQGHKKEADEIFNAVFQFLDKVCVEFPRYAEGHSDLARLAAFCKRQPDQAFVHAQKAVELQPKNAAYLDTLAEVHFQRGEREKAIETIKQCIALDAQNEQYQQQLKRFEIAK